MCTGFRISEQSYGSKHEIIGGIEQGNLASRESYKVKSCRIIESIENKNLGIKIYQLSTKTSIERIVIAFVDNTSFYSNRDNLQKKIIMIIQHYTRLYKAT